MSSEVLRQLYYDADKPFAFSSPAKLYRAAKKRDPKITLSQVKEWLATQTVPSKFQPPSHHKWRTTFRINKSCDTLGSDLADMRRLKRYNSGYGWFCVMVDLFTRQIVGAVPQKTKRAADTAEAIDAALRTWTEKRPHCRFRVFFTDAGNEYKGRCNQVYSHWRLKHETTTDNEIKVSLAEKTISHIKTRLWKEMNYRKSWKWIDLIEGCVSALNNSVNRNLDMTPNEAASPWHQDDVWRRSHQRQFDKNIIRLAKRGYEFKFSVGDVVRIQLNQSSFDKRYENNFSTELFVVYKRALRSYVPVYWLKDYLSGEKVTGSFTEEELRLFKPSQPKPAIDGVILGRRLDPDNKLQLKLRKRGWVDYDDIV